MKLSVYIATSLDGFIARENGDLDWLPGADGGDPGEDYGYKDFFDSVDVLIMGRNTYEKVLSFGSWPYKGRRVIVLSNQQIAIPNEIENMVEQRSGTPAKLVDELSKEGVNHVYVDGGKTIQRFLNAGLINELTISRIPILIGRGIPLFGELENDIELQHIETNSFSNGIVQSMYRIVT